MPSTTHRLVRCRARLAIVCGSGGVLTMSLEKPRFRRDLEAVPLEADGERYVEVRDVAAGWSYCFYDFEYRVALALDGLPLDKVTPRVKLSTGLELQVDQLRAFAER